MKRRFLLSALFLLAGGGRADSFQHRYTAVICGRLIDGISATPRENVTVLIDSNRNVEVRASRGDLPPGTQIVDLSAATVMPGFIDCHTHITGEIEDYLNDTFRKTPIDAAVEAHIYAKRTLEAGFTTCRDVGAGEYVDVALKRAIDAGKVPGPRLFVAGLALSATGGHGDLNGFSPYLKFQHFSGVVDGVGEIRKRIRENFKYGADLIKFTATAGVLSEEESAGAPQFSREEMQAIVEEAAMWGKRVAAHAHGAEGIRMAVEAGVTSIEHGSLIDAEGIAMMKKRGTFLVPTVYAARSVIEHAKEWNLPEKVVMKAREIEKQKRDCTSNAIKAGVKIAYGTDAGVFAHGNNAADFPILIEFGISEMQAIQSATSVAAELLDMKGKLGEVSPGAYADLVAVQKNPLTDIKALLRVDFVMKDGKIYKNELATK